MPMSSPFAPLCAPVGLMKSMHNWERAEEYWPERWAEPGAEYSGPKCVEDMRARAIYSGHSGCGQGCGPEAGLRTLSGYMAAGN